MNDYIKVSRWAIDRQIDKDLKVAKMLGILLLILFVAGTAYSYAHWGKVQL